jgi:cytochrome P450
MAPVDLCSPTFPPPTRRPTNAALFFQLGRAIPQGTIPFLSGPRMCGGAKLARMELTEGLKAFLRRFKVERQGTEITFDYGLALRPNSWQRVQISKRN